VSAHFTASACHGSCIPVASVQSRDGPYALVRVTDILALCVSPPISAESCEWAIFFTQSSCGKVNALHLT